MIQKHTAQFTTPADPRFDATDYVVTASPEEVHLLWCKWHHFYGVGPWEDERSNFVLHIASLDERPLWVDVQWAQIGGKRVAFASGQNGRLIDEALIEAWCCSVFRCLHDIDLRPSRRANATNFADVLLGIRRAGKLVARDHGEVERAIRAVQVKPCR